MEDCYFVDRSNKCKNLYFSNFSTNVNRGIFCSSLTNKSNVIFNEEISEKKFDFILKQLYSIIEDYELDKKDHLFIKDYMADMLWENREWVKSLPGYEPIRIYSVTFDNRWLIEN